MRFGGGGEVTYDFLILATGSKTRRLAVPGCDLKGLHQLRTVKDAEGLREAIGCGRPAVIDFRTSAAVGAEVTLLTIIAGVQS